MLFPPLFVDFSLRRCTFWNTKGKEQHSTEGASFLCFLAAGQENLQLPQHAAAAGFSQVERHLPKSQLAPLLGFSTPPTRPFPADTLNAHPEFEGRIAGATTRAGLANLRGLREEAGGSRRLLQAAGGGAGNLPASLWGALGKLRRGGSPSSVARASPGSPPS